MTEQEKALKRFEAEDVISLRSKPHKDWDEVIRKGRIAEKNAKKLKNNIEKQQF